MTTQTSWMDETNLVPLSNEDTIPMWKSCENLSDLTIVPLNETDHQLLHKDFMYMKTIENRGVSMPVEIEFKNVTTAQYNLSEEVFLGPCGSGGGWNVLCNLNVSAPNNAKKYFCFDGTKISFENTLFKKDTKNDSPLPCGPITWIEKGKEPQIQVELETAGDIVITFNKVYTANDLGKELMFTPSFSIPIEKHFLIIKDGYIKLDE